MVTSILNTKILQSLFTMAEVVEARDAYTGGHLWRVSQFSRLLAQQIHLDASHVVQAALGGFLHDLGKVGVPDDVLNKPGKLTKEEYDVIKTHPSIGAELIDQHPLASLVKDAIELHHERPDGKGYPHGKDDIPMIAKIVGITDAFDAMTSTRPYRKGLPVEKVIEIIKEHSGTQFDEALAAAFIELINTGLLKPIIGHTSLGIPLLDCPVCGPTMHIHSKQKHGDIVYCRNCGESAKLEIKEGYYSLVMMGEKGDSQDRHPVADIEVIHELVAEILVNLTLEEEKSKSWLQRVFG